MRSLQDFSMRKGALDTGKVKPAWPDVPYHFYIDCTGAIYEGRNPELVGDTNTDYDPSGHLLIVVEGNFEKEKVNLREERSLKELVEWLKFQFGIDDSGVGTHRDYAKTACPGKNLSSLINKWYRTNAAGSGA